MLKRIKHNKNCKNPHKKGVTFNVQDRVVIQNALSGKWEDFGKIVGIRMSGQSFVIFTESTNKLIVRNRKFVKKFVGGQ